MKLTFTIILSCLLSLSSYAQEKETTIQTELTKLPYHQIPDYPEDFTPATVTARMIDGLGFRYYWASKDLRPEDLDYLPGNNGSSTLETLRHIHGLSKTVLNGVKNEPNIRGGAPAAKLTYETLRANTLHNLKAASDYLKEHQTLDLNDAKVIFKREEKTSEYPFWNLLNGMLADAIYHTGQIVSFRRSAGNPTNPKVSVFQGRLRE